MSQKIKVLYVCSELFPLLKTGGLADVSAALPPALQEAGCDVRVLLPGFPSVLAGVLQAQYSAGAPIAIPASSGPRQGALLQKRRLQGSDLPCYVLEAPDLFDRPGNPYLNDQGQEWPDNAIRFATLSWSAACLGFGLDADWRPDIVHCHDWHTGLVPLYIKQLEVQGKPSPATVFTIHNLAYQGLFPRSAFDQLGLPLELFGIEGVEFYGQVSYMKAGLQFADRITTVSPSYAREILTAEQGCGLDGLLKARSGVLSGVLNGVDYLVWSPAHDLALDTPYDWKSLPRKKKAKAQLQQRMGLQNRPEALVFGVVSRLIEQKGLHLVQSILDELVEQGGQLALLGGGDPKLEQAFLAAAEKHPGQVAVKIGYNEELGHAIVGGSDVILVPSHFEPCGLTQLYGLRYGTLPLVRRVGGLADTVVDASAENLRRNTASGFVFDDFSPAGLQSAVKRVFGLFADPVRWAAVQQHAMKLRFDWLDAAQKYLTIYGALLRNKTTN